MPLGTELNRAEASYYVDQGFLMYVVIRSKLNIYRFECKVIGGARPGLVGCHDCLI